MGEDNDLPEGTRLSADQASAPVSEAKSADGGRTYGVAAPEMLGLQCQVQDGTLRPGDPPEEKPGLVGCGVIIVEGHPVFVLNIKHPNGKGLSGLLEPDEFIEFSRMWMALPMRAAVASAAPAGEG